MMNGQWDGRRHCMAREVAFDRPRDFLNNHFVYVVISARARGLSVGVNMNPDKQCNFDCLYCEVDRSTPAAATDLNTSALAAELHRTLAFVLQGRLR